MYIVAKTYNDKRFGLGEPVATMLRDFCAANYNASATEVMREAIREHIQARLDNEPVIRERYEKARRARLGLSETVVSLAASKPND